MNALLIAGIVALTIWWMNHRSARPRRPHRPSDDALSHALQGNRPWTP